MDVNISQHGLKINNNRYDWSDVKGIYIAFWTNRPIIRIQGSPDIALPKEHADQFVESFYKHWKQSSPEAAQKNAFDYVESPKQGAGLMIAICVLFCFVLSSLLFHDSYSHYTCSQAITQNAVVQDANVIKAKKKKRGNFEVELSFTTESGQTLTGKRMTVKTYDIGEELGKVSVVYAKHMPHCWSISEEYGKNSLNWAKRRYLTLFNLLVGLSFTIVGILGVYWSVHRMRVVRPGREQVIQLFQFKI